MTFSAQPPDLHRLSLGRESFAASGPLALLDSASYPIPVRRLADSLTASFNGPLTVAALRITWVATTNSPGDSHPQDIVHAGHTSKRRLRHGRGRLLGPGLPAKLHRQRHVTPDGHKMCPVARATTDLLSPRPIRRRTFSISHMPTSRYAIPLTPPFECECSMAGVGHRVDHARENTREKVNNPRENITRSGGSSS